MDFQADKPAVPLKGLSEADADGAGKNFRGIEDLGEVILSCPTCKKKVVRIQIVSNTPEFTVGKGDGVQEVTVVNRRKYYGVCSCGDTTFPKEITGEVFLAAHEPLLMIDVDYDLENDKVTVKTTNGKK